jgi:sterol desaturase/sphingolipid hydroxylase (fatty acid hydroxylase superfamily)
MSIADSLLPLGIFFGLGFLTHLGEAVWPLRKYAKPKALRVDLIGFAVTLLGLGIVERVQVPALARLPSLPGFAWMPTVARLVERRVPWPIALVMSVVMLDFLLYLGHRLLHTSALWHTHAAHHSVEHLYWFGGNRASPVHVAVQGAWGTLLALVWPIKGGLSGLVIVLVIYACIQHFNHANLNWRLGGLGWLFVTPRYHFVHHGADPKLNGSNFGFLFTVWDRMFGTYVNPDSLPNDFPLGLNYPISTVRMLVGLGPSRSR